MVIRVVLLDAGGILFSNVTEESDFLVELAERHGADLDRLAARLDARDGEYEVDRRHVHDVLIDCIAEAGGSRERWDADWVDARYRANVRAHPVAFAALGRFRDRHPGVLLALANNEAAHWDRLKDRDHHHLDRFDVIGSSWALAAVKPGEDYFDRLLAACGRKAEEALFIDDNADNVTAATRYGIHSVLATDPEIAAGALSGLGSGWGGA
ncbi:HAD family hydrolase [Actinokineospora guangxiensis]|uniref:HAD family hydrolase n=1 Tax=Actinokineospora guangxiensis TaxID=1490288 RepID=A0ABW0EK56_9PSEU